MRRAKKPAPPPLPANQHHLFFAGEGKQYKDLPLFTGTPPYVPDNQAFRPEPVNDPNVSQPKLF